MKLFVSENTDPAFNLALEETLLRNGTEDAFMLWRNSKSVIIGCNQNARSEIDLEYANANKIRIVRRTTGGGAVYHDLGNVNYSFFTSSDGKKFEDFEPFARPIINAISSFGIMTLFSGRNDIILSDGRKISGSAKTFSGTRLLFHGTLLFDTDFEAMTKVLTPDEGKVRSKGVKSVKSRVGNLSEFLSMTREKFFTHLGDAVKKYFSVEDFDAIDKKILDEAEALAEKKYRSWNWNFGRAPSYSFSRKARLEGCGSVNVAFNVSDGLIQDVKITGDFFGEKPVNELEKLLSGTRHDFEEIRKRLASLHVEKYVSNAAPETIAGLFV